MGFYSSSSTQKVDIPEPTEQEKKNAALESAAIRAALEASGYSTSTTPKLEYDNPERVSSLEDTLANLNQQKEELMVRLENASTTPTKTGMGATVIGQNERKQVQQKLDALNRQINDTNNQLTSEKSKSKTTYETELIKLEDKRVQDLIDKGDVEGANALREKLKQQDLALMDKQDSMTNQFYDSVEKWLNGDLSLNPQQEADMLDIQEKYKAPIMTAIDGIRKEIGATEGNTLSAIERRQTEGLAAIQDTVTGSFAQLNEVIGQIKQTGLDTEGALFEAENRIREGGIGLKAALNESITASRALAEQGIFKQTRDLRVSSAELAASLGRNTTDPRFLKDLNEKTAEIIKDTELNLAAMSASGALQIEQKTVDALNAISGLRISLAETQGKRLEDVAKQKAGLVENAGLRGEALTSDTGTARAETIQSAGLRREDVAKLRTGTEEQASKVGLGIRESLLNPVGALAAGNQGISTATSAGQLPISNLLNISNPLQNSLSRDANLRAQEKTITTTSSPSMFENILNVGSTVAGVAKGGVGVLDFFKKA